MTEVEFLTKIRQSPKPPPRVPPPIIRLTDDPAADLRYATEQEKPLWFVRWLKVDPAAAIAWLAALDSIDQAAVLVPMVIEKRHQGDPLAFLASLDDRWTTNSRWGAIRGLAVWCSEDRHQHIDAIYRAVRENERRSFLVRLANQSPSHEFVRWMETNEIPDDDGYLTRRVLDRLMLVYSDFPRSPEWKERSEAFIAALAGTQAQQRYRTAIEQIGSDDARVVGNEALLDLLHTNFTEGHRRLAERFRSTWEENMRQHNQEASGHSGPPVMNDLAQLGYRYEASRDAAFRSAMRSHSKGQGNMDNAISAYQESIATASPALREKVMVSLVSSLVQYDPEEGIESAIRVLGLDAVRHCINADEVYKWPNGLEVVRSLGMHGVWSNTNAARITTLRNVTNQAFQWNESATLETLAGFPDSEARRPGMEMVRELLIDAGRLAEAEELR